MKLRVIASDPIRAKVFLDDKELHGVTDLDVRMHMGAVHEATLTIRPSEVELEGEIVVKEGPQHA